MAQKLSEYEAYEQNQYLLHGRYKYVDRIQKGSFGTVTLALDVQTNTNVAMKAMHKSKEVAAIARHEVSILRRLGRTNDYICQLVDSFETDAYIVLVLEYCANGDLYDVIHSGDAPRALDVWDLAREMLCGIEYAHSLGIYHRDLKPENILFTAKGRVKICDWGLAARTRHSRDFNVGTEKYMAPECFLRGARNPATYDCKYADYWSFGITVLTAVFGKAPFKPMVADNSDPFRKKGNTVHKLLESDSNFKKFVLCNRPEMLYDIYPDMNENCFRIFMHLLKVGGVEDDDESYADKILQRSLKDFIADLELNWKYGLTVWDEEFEEPDVAPESLFAMDDFGSANDKKGDDDDFRIEPFGAEAIRSDASNSLPLPSLVESTYQPKLWYELDNELDDNEFNRLFQSLNFRNGTPTQKEPAKGGIRIFEKELLVDERLSWSDY